MTEVFHVENPPFEIKVAWGVKGKDSQLLIGAAAHFAHVQGPEIGRTPRPIAAYLPLASHGLTSVVRTGAFDRLASRYRAGDVHYHSAP